MGLFTHQKQRSLKSLLLASAVIFGGIFSYSHTALAGSIGISPVFTESYVQPGRISEDEYSFFISRSEDISDAWFHVDTDESLIIPKDSFDIVIPEGEKRAEFIFSVTGEGKEVGDYYTDFNVMPSKQEDKGGMVSVLVGLTGGVTVHVVDILPVEEKEVIEEVERLGLENLYLTKTEDGVDASFQVMNHFDDATLKNVHVNVLVRDINTKTEAFSQSFSYGNVVFGEDKSEHVSMELGEGNYEIVLQGDFLSTVDGSIVNVESTMVTFSLNPKKPIMEWVLYGLAGILFSAGTFVMFYRKNK